MQPLKHAQHLVFSGTGRWKLACGPDQLAYPEATILDGRLVFVYDRNRRDVLFVETDLK